MQMSKIGQIAFVTACGCLYYTTGCPYTLNEVRSAILKKALPPSYFISAKEDERVGDSFGASAVAEGAFSASARN